MEEERSRASERSDRAEGLRFESVCVDIAGGKRVLWNVTGHASPGRVLAIMGPSGSGKTTLLNAIAGHLPISEGLVTLNGQKTGKKTKRTISYVVQHDVFFPNLTLRETLQYSALLRLPVELTFRQKLNKVEEIIQTLHLEDCASTIIGDQIIRGLSGGEKKRASIGCELLTDPTLLLLDEPTSGLDSSSAYSLLETVKTLAESQHKTVITSIHQPSSQIYYMFDKLLLLAKGKVAYFGQADRILDHFSHLGLQTCSDECNPADYMLDLVTDAESRKVLIGDDPKQGKESQQRSWWQRLLKCCRKDKENDMPVEILDYPESPRLPARNFSVPSEDSKREEVPVKEEGEKELSIQSGTVNSPKRKWASPWYLQVLVLTARTFRQSRHIILAKMHLLFCALVVFLCSVVWFQIPKEEESIIDRLGVIFFTAVFWMFNPLVWALQSFPRERAVLSKERARGSHHLSAYYIAKVLSEIPLVIVLPTFYVLVVYWSAGLNSAPSAFFGSWFLYLLGAFVGQSLGLAIGATVLDFEVALTVAIILGLTLMLLGGYVTQNLPFWLNWAKTLSFITFLYEGLLQLEFSDDQHFSCSHEASSYVVCSNSTVDLYDNATILGSEVVQSLGLLVPLYADVLILFVFLFGLHMYAYCMLRFLHRK